MIRLMKLILAGVPLGNPGDATIRLIEAIKEAKVIAAEDTRKFQRLCQDLQIKSSAKLISFFEGNELERTDSLLAELQSGATILVVTDAGMPTISDPGFKLVRAVVDAQIPIQVLPGPSAVTTALALSGLPTDRFCFEGFIPRSPGAREKFFEQLRFEERTIVCFESPHRLIESIDCAIKYFDQIRRVAICREMTKTYEETVRGSLMEIKEWSTSKEILGELTIVFEGATSGSKQITQSEIVQRVLEFESVGMARKEAISKVATDLDLAKRDVFDAMVAAKNPD